MPGLAPGIPLSSGAIATRNSTAAGLCPAAALNPASPRQRVGADLELDHLGLGSLAGLGVERRTVAVRRPDAAALPAGIRIVDTAIHPLGEEAERIRDTHVDPLAVHPCHQRLVGVAGR